LTEYLNDKNPSLLVLMENEKGDGGCGYPNDNSHNTKKELNVNEPKEGEEKEEKLQEQWQPQETQPQEKQQDLQAKREKQDNGSPTSLPNE